MLRYLRLLSRHRRAANVAYFTLLLPAIIYLLIRPSQDEFFKKYDRKVNPYPFKITITPRSCLNTTDVMVIVKSHPSYEDRRDRIRNSWAKYVRNGQWVDGESLNYNVRVAFILGESGNSDKDESVKWEAERYGDIIRGDFHDSYKNLTYKTLMAVKWTSEKCPSLKYFLSCDDDVIINFRSMFRVLESSNVKTNSIWGRYTWIMFTNRRGKHKVTFSQYPFILYPPYMRGAGYVISGDLMGQLFRTSEYVPVLPIDDVYITGFLARILGINLYTDGTLWRTFNPTACDILTQGIIVSVFDDPRDQTNVWKQLETSPKGCYKCGLFTGLTGLCPKNPITLVT